MTELEKKFEEELRDDMSKAKEECGYNATYFLRMLEENGGVKTAKILIQKSIKTNQISDGFVRLRYFENKPEFTMESCVIKEEYSSLFTQEEIQYCKDLLDK